MKLKVTVDGTAYDVEVEVEAEPTPQLGVFFAPISGSPSGMPLAPAHAKAPANEEKVLRSPISGTVISVKVENGQAVEAGQTLIILEAMKMETEITAPVAGTVAQVTVAPGQPVKGGETLIEFE